VSRVDLKKHLFFLSGREENTGLRSTACFACSFVCFFFVSVLCTFFKCTYSDLVFLGCALSLFFAWCTGKLFTDNRTSGWRDIHYFNVSCWGSYGTSKLLTCPHENRIGFSGILQELLSCLDFESLFGSSI
jgi:hypothetical protein